MEGDEQDSAYNFFTDDDGVSFIERPALKNAHTTHISLRRVPSWSSVSSVATAVPAFGKIDLTLGDFCKYIDQHSSLQEARIRSTECYAESAGAVTHRFLVLELSRPRRKDVYVRLDRRAAEGTSVFRFLVASGTTKANDRALIASNKSLLVGAATLENRQDFITPPRLHDLAQLLRIVCREIVTYRLWPANCWFFCSLIQQHLEGAQNGWFTNGALQYANIAQDIRTKVRDHYHLVQETSFSTEFKGFLRQLSGTPTGASPSELQLAAREALRSVGQWHVLSYDCKSSQARASSQRVSNAVNRLCLLLHRENRDNDAVMLMQNIIKHQLALFRDYPDAHRTYLALSYHNYARCLRSCNRVEGATLAQGEYNRLSRQLAQLDPGAFQALVAHPLLQLEADDLSHVLNPTTLHSSNSRRVPESPGAATGSGVSLYGAYDYRQTQQQQAAQGILGDSMARYHPSSDPFMPSLGGPGPQLRAPEFSGAQTQQQTQQAAPASSHEGKLSVSIDFGTAFSGVSYGSSRLDSATIRQILTWPGTSEDFRKIPTCLLYDQSGYLIAWGLEARLAEAPVGAHRCEWFKLFLEPRALRDDALVDPRLPELPPGKRAVDLIVDFLSCLWEYAREQITRESGSVADLDTANIWLTVPAAWDAKGCQIMRDAALQAGLVSAATIDDHNWRDRLHIITEPEAAAIHCVHLTDLHQLRPTQNFIICDAGGGSVDLAVYKTIGSLENLEIAEVCARIGSNCGSLFLDLRFRELVRALLAEHPVHLDPISLAYFMHAFSDSDKLTYQGESDDANMFHFTCFNVEDPDDPSVGLVNGELSIPGYLIRREVFDPVVEQVLSLIEEQSRRVDQRVEALLLVGGFSGNEYLFKRVTETFSSRIKVIARPPDPDTATSRGAARYGLSHRPLVSSIIAPRSYIMRVKLLAEQEDWRRRPAYIHKNNAGVDICENRLQYLVLKGAILRRGQLVWTKFRKYSETPRDDLFVAVMYVSDSDKSMRYTDEGATTELCQWTVDLKALPSFQQQASNTQSGGFYTEFELGLELDSAEVRGVLFYNGHECGRVSFDFFA